MPVVAAIALPHPPLILPDVGKGEERGIQKTIDACRAAAALLARHTPETVVIISPHTAMFRDWFEIAPGAEGRGDFARFGAPGLRFTAHYDAPLANKIGALAEARGIPAGPSGQSDAALDHGVMIPLAFLDEAMSGYRVVRVGLSGLPAASHYALGRCIAEAAGGKRVAVVASGDLSHKLREDGPYGFAPEGPALDAAITGALAKGDFGALLSIDPVLADRGAECGLRSFAMMAGAFDGLDVKAELLSYEGPFGVGYAVATFVPGGQNPARRFAGADEAPADETPGEDPYVALARLSLTRYIQTGRPAKLPKGLPPEMTQNRAGTFVSLHKEGELRGCIGTIAPTTGSVAEEILQNAVSASTRDPRFPPVGEEELGALSISVDVLQPAEPVDSIAHLDPARYGVIVSNGPRRGLLLPNLDGVDTAEEQVDIARRKAGIPAGAPLRLERFEVVRHGRH